MHNIFWVMRLIDVKKKGLAEKEQELRSYYERRMADLNTQNKAADAKAQQLQEEYSQLLVSLKEKEKERDSLIEKMTKTSEELNEAKSDMGIPYQYKITLSTSS